MSGGYDVLAGFTAGPALAGCAVAAAAGLVRSSRRIRMVTAVTTKAASAIAEAARNPRVIPAARAWW